MMKSTPPELSQDQLLDLHDAAADLYVRRQLPGWTAADERALAQWLAADLLHRSTFEGMGGTWVDAAQLAQQYPQSYAQPAVNAAVARPKAAVTWWRRPVLAGALSACLVLLVAGGWYRWQHTPDYVLELSTAHGETRRLDLPDGSTLDLNADSRLTLRYYPQRRELALERGEAFFSVAADASRPFTVDSGPSQIKVVGTRFNVHAAPPRLTVTVLDGQVEVRALREDAAAPVLVLGPGTGVALDSVTGSQRNLRTQPADVGDWRSGQLRFSRAPLAEVAADVARYLDKPVTVDAALRTMVVSGFLATDAPERFLQALPELIPVRATRMPDESWHISGR